MRMRLLAFLPLAGLFTFLVLLSASSLVSALERSIAELDRRFVFRLGLAAEADGVLRDLEGLRIGHEFDASLPQVV